ncbi:MAG: AMP-binding protein [Geminicoccaceae bacterium]|nr:AMP-binding protein [Geminicoccaceae bacterium]
MFERNALRSGAEPGVAIGGETFCSHALLAGRAARLGGWMRSRAGLEPGARVAIILTNRAEYIETALACWWAGLAAVPVNARLHPHELAFAIAHSEAGLVVSEERFTASLDCACRVLTVDAADYRHALEADPIALMPRDQDDLAWLFYTSGTTGRPKGAMITHGNIRAMTYSYFIDIDTIGEGDAIFHAAPLSHGSGLYMFPHAARGAVQVVPESGGFDPLEIEHGIARRPGTTMFAAPTMVKRLTRHVREHGGDWRNLKTVVYGGAPMYLADLDEAHATFGHRFAQLYGQGESPMTITALDKAAHANTGHPRYRERLQSAGTAQTVVEVRIGDAQGLALPKGERGEIMARGASVVPGYWRDPEATRRTMGDGWLRTGDVGEMDEDGFVTLKDRSKDLIISGGTNVYPREVEEVLLRHAGIREVSVIGIPDPEWGERIVACIVEASPTEDCELDRHCLDHIARFKRPKTYLRLTGLPKNNYGKVLKTELRARFAET